MRFDRKNNYTPQRRKKKTMYISIGTEKTVKIKDIVGIFDMDVASSTKSTRDFLKNAEKKGLVESTGYDIPKSFVVTTDKTYLSQLSSHTLVGRTL